MSKAFQNQVCVVLWGGREIGRAVTLAFARSGSAVAFADPNASDVDRLRELLLTKDADIFGVPWTQPVTEGGQGYREAASIAQEKLRAGHPFFHRLVLTFGLDQRFWSGSAPGETPTWELIHARLRALLEFAHNTMTTQDKPGRLVILWPADREGSFDPVLSALIREGTEHLRHWVAEPDAKPLAVSLVWVGPSEEGIWAQAANVPTAERLRSGEIGESVVALASLPRRVCASEITLEAE